jgi:ACT domain-containing protein
MHSLAQRQYAEAQASKTKLEDALKNQPLRRSAITQFRDDYHRLDDGFSTRESALQQRLRPRQTSRRGLAGARDKYSES